MEKLIYIVDDEEELAKNLQMELQAMKPQWKFKIFTKGMDALQSIYTEKVSLVLTDIAMLDMDGYELYWRINEYQAEIPVIMMTGFGYDPNHVLVRAKVDGLTEVLYKPFVAEDALERMEKILEPTNLPGENR